MEFIETTTFTRLVRSTGNLLLDDSERTNLHATRLPEKQEGHPHWRRNQHSAGTGKGIESWNRICLTT